MTISVFVGARAPCCPRMPRMRLLASALALAICPAWVAAQTVPPSGKSAGAPATAPDVVVQSATTLDRVTVVGRRQSLVGEAISASEGIVGQTDIADRPLLRTGDLLEFVPGLVATQHSGSGKANQYFLRGFNLDHGTDFATFVDGMPVNMRTHGHGQGWTDLNFLIPETVQQLDYRKGTYYADVGDFSSTGSVRFQLADTVPRGQASVTIGDDAYARGIVVDSAKAAGGDLLYGLELQTYDGPWTDIKEDVRKASALLRYSADIGGGRGHLNVMAYRNAWNSADQVPQRAVDQGLIDEFGSLDTSVGGKASRYSLSGGWKGTLMGGDAQVEAYAIDSSLDLYSNFTYFLDDPVNGDQFNQVDERKLYGFMASQQWDVGRSRWRVGAEGRYDDIDRVGLFRTAGRQRVSTVREDAVKEGSLGVFLANEFRVSDKLRTYVGVRHDAYTFEVDSSLPANSGDAADGITSYKTSVAYQANASMEFYASYGTGFHSNDARGTTITVDPVSGDATPRVDPLVGSKGAELGARFQFSNRLHATLAVWTLELESELLFVGDAGNTEASRPSRRDGTELGLYWFPSERYSANFEAAYTRSRFEDDDPVGDAIPGSIPLVISSGVTAHYDNGWQASMQLKHFGRYPLIEDNRVESDGSTIVNLRVGREWQRVGLHLDVLNLLGSDDHDIDFFYASRLQSEPAEGIDDIHYHVFPSRTLRLSVRYMF